MESQVYQGIVKWFGSKGEAYGYIHRFKHLDGSDGEAFVHYRNLSQEGQENPKFKVLKKGQQVRFEIGPGFPSGKGTQAINVVVLNASFAQSGGTETVLPQAG